MYIQNTGKNMKQYTALYFLFAVLLASLLMRPLQADYTIAYTLADQVNVRAEASTNAKIIATLPIGTKLTILQTEDTMLTLKGYKAPWVMVQFKEHGKSSKGYIWQGLISYDMVNSQDIMFLLGIERVRDASSPVAYQIRAARNNKELSKLVFDGVGTITTNRQVTLSDNKGVTQITSIININFDDSRCAGAFGDVVIFWDGKKLYHAKTLRHGYDAPMFYEERLIFPRDKGGKPGIIIWKARGGEFDDDGTEHLDTNKKVVYRWNGKSLVKK
jgi:hypothetical protein